MMTFYKHLPSRARLIAEYLRHNTVVWLEMLATATERAGLSPVERILAIFDALDVSFQKPPFRGCPFVKGLAEFGPDADSPEVHWMLRLRGDPGAMLHGYGLNRRDPARPSGLAL